jgi:hypothetical protein
MAGTGAAARALPICRTGRRLREAAAQPKKHAAHCRREGPGPAALSLRANCAHPDGRKFRARVYFVVFERRARRTAQVRVCAPIVARLVSADIPAFRFVAVRETRAKVLPGPVDKRFSGGRHSIRARDGLAGRIFAKVTKVNSTTGFITLLALAAIPAGLNAQDLSKYTSFTIEGRPVQVHGFVSQGFGYSDTNNYLTMKTNEGSFGFTDGGLNISAPITDKFRVGAQVYDRNIGNLGRWHPQLDWAFADYRFKDWFGFRAGKVKTVLGLYNDTQDMDFLHTFALLPQSVYPLDLRASTIAHTGIDVYGHISIRRRGDLSYTGYVGSRPFDRYGGYVYGLAALGLQFQNFSARQAGADLRWNNLINGLTFGASFLDQPASGSGTANLQTLAGPAAFPVPVIIPYTIHVNADHRLQFYTEYKRGRLTLDGEYSRETVAGTDNTGLAFALDQRSWYTAAAFRLCKVLELGAYHSWFYPDWKQSDLSLPVNHIFDQAVTANFALTRYWGLKLEGHFMDGYGEPYSFQGFYPQDNPQGLKPKTNLFVIRTGFNF